MGTAHVYCGPIKIAADGVLCDIGCVLPRKPVSMRTLPLLGLCSTAREDDACGKSLPRPSPRSWTTSWLGSQYVTNFILGHRPTRDPGSWTYAGAALRADKPRCSRKSRARSTTVTQVNKEIYTRKMMCVSFVRKSGLNVKNNEAKR